MAKAQADLGTRMLAARTAHRAALVAAFAMENGSARQAAIRAAGSAFRTANTDARVKFHAEIKATVGGFTTSIRQCHPVPQTNWTVPLPTRKREGKDDNGMRMGEFKKVMTETRTSGNGSASATSVIDINVGTSNSVNVDTDEDINEYVKALIKTKVNPSMRAKMGW